jgi:hypothetical protein
MMIPLIPKPGLTHRQKAAAITVAGVADFIQIMLIPALFPGFIADEIIDFVVAIIMIAICGFKWQFVAAFLFELIPGLGLLPTWSAVALTLPTRSDDSTVTASPGSSGRPPIQITATVVPPVQSPPASQ